MVIVILAILATVVVPRVMHRPEQARKVKVEADILAIQNAMDLYQLDNGFYPSTEQGLAALVAKPSGEPVPNDWQPGGYLKSLPKDAWGRAYHYKNPGEHGLIDIWSDGKNEGELIGNW